MNTRRYKGSVMHKRPWPKDCNFVGRSKKAGSVVNYPLPVAEAACTDKVCNRAFYGVNLLTVKRYCGDGLAGWPIRMMTKRKAVASRHCPRAGVTSVRWRMNGCADPPDAGFSLAECLVALALLSLGMVALGQYHRQLVDSLQVQWAHRNTLLAAAQTLIGKPVTGFDSQLIAQPQQGGCVLLIAKASGPRGRRAQLQQLSCPRR